MDKQAVGWIVSELVGLWEGPEGRKEGAREGPLGAMDGPVGRIDGPCDGIFDGLLVGLNTAVP